MDGLDASAAGRALAARRRVVGPIRCPECGREVLATTAGRLKKTFCSRACQRKSWRRRNPERVRAYERAAYRRRVARARAAQEAQEG